MGAFEFTLHLQYYCLCHLPAYSESICTCNYKRAVEECFWKKMLRQVQESSHINTSERKLIIEGKTFDGFLDGKETDSDDDEGELARNNRLTALLAPVEKDYTIKGRRQSKILLKYREAQKKSALKQQQLILIDQIITETH